MYHQAFDTDKRPRDLNFPEKQEKGLFSYRAMDSSLPGFSGRSTPAVQSDNFQNRSLLAKKQAEWNAQPERYSKNELLLKKRREWDEEKRINRMNAQMQKDRLSRPYERGSECNSGRNTPPPMKSLVQWEYSSGRQRQAHEHYIGDHKIKPKTTSAARGRRSFDFQNPKHNPDYSFENPRALPSLPLQENLGIHQKRYAKARAEYFAQPLSPREHLSHRNQNVEDRHSVLADYHTQHARERRDVQAKQFESLNQQKQQLLELQQRHREDQQLAQLSERERELRHKEQVSE